MAQPPGSRRTDKDDAKREAETLGDTARDAGREAYTTVSREAERQTGQAKEGAASEVNDISSALRRAASESRSGSPQERTFGQVADAFADLSDTIRTKDLGETVGDLNSFARRNPVAFLGGAALLGFAATRFAKASESGVSDSSPASPAVTNTTMPEDRS